MRKACRNVQVCVGGGRAPYPLTLRNLRLYLHAFCALPEPCRRGREGYLERASDAVNVGDSVDGAIPALPELGAVSGTRSWLSEYFSECFAEVAACWSGSSSSSYAGGRRRVRGALSFSRFKYFFATHPVFGTSWMKSKYST